MDLAAHDDTSIFVCRGQVPPPCYPASDGMAPVRAVDLSAQEDARQRTWAGPRLH